MNKFIIYICFYFPLVSSCLNFQAFIGKFISINLAQNFAYLNVLLLILGIFIFYKHKGNLSSINKLWLTFYIVYYSFAILATAIHGFTSSILATLVAPIYFIAFNLLLSNPEQFKTFFKVLTISMVISSFFTIYFYQINFDFDVSGVLRWKVDRAEGLYGDANNAALASIISYILFDKFHTPTKTIFKIIKILILASIFYSIFITFSTTGLFAFVIIFFILNYKFFTGIKFILFGVGIILFYIGVFSIKSKTSELDLTKAQINKIDNIINVVTLNVEDVNTSGRTDLLDNLMHYLFENPILGNGINFAAQARGHNTYLGVWVDAGLLTFLFFLFVLCCYMFKTFGLDLHRRLFILSILTSLYVFMLSLQTVINQPYLVVLFAFIGYIIDRNHKSEDNLNFIKK